SLGLASAMLLPALFGVPAQWGAVGLTASAGVAGWIEFHLLRRKMNQKLGPTGVPARILFKLWSAACLAAVAGCAVEYLVPSHSPIVTAIYVLGVHGMAYFAVTYLMHIRECVELMGKLLRRARVG
ncbi:MAG: murein biosynthesis integral membrane protein MurJ, partial [Gammaproteobacteria bacterium]